MFTGTEAGPKDKPRWGQSHPHHWEDCGGGDSLLPRDRGSEGWLPTTTMLSPHTRHAPHLPNAHLPDSSRSEGTRRAGQLRPAPAAAPPESAVLPQAFEHNQARTSSPPCRAVYAEALARRKPASVSTERARACAGRGVFPRRPGGRDQDRDAGRRSGGHWCLTSRRAATGSDRSVLVG